MSRVLVSLFGITRLAEGQIFLSSPNSHGRFFFLHTLPVFIAFGHFKCKTLTNILTETRSIFLQLHLYSVCSGATAVVVIHYTQELSLRKCLKNVSKKFF